MFSMILEENYEELDDFTLCSVNGGACCGGCGSSGGSSGWTGSGTGQTGGGTGNSVGISGTWGTIDDSYNRNRVMQEYRDDNNPQTRDESMNGSGNSFSTDGCKMEAAAKIATEILGKSVSLDFVNSVFDGNKDGLLTTKEISDGINKNMWGGNSVKMSAWEGTLDKRVLDSISRESGKTYVLGRAEGVHGGQHWVVLEGYSLNSYGQVEFKYNGTSRNDNGRTYVLGNPISGVQNNTYRISKIETYTVK